MILQITPLYIVPGKEADFEDAFKQAIHLVEGFHGYQNHQLVRCIEEPSRYSLIIQWGSLEDHTVHFRASAEHLIWKHTLNPFYARVPRSEHFAIRQSACLV